MRRPLWGYQHAPAASWTESGHEQCNPGQGLLVNDRAWGLGFRVLDLGFRVLGLGSGAQQTPEIPFLYLADRLRLWIAFQ